MSKAIKGITIEIDGNTSGLDKALKDVNSTSVKLNTELKEVNKLLKFNPGDTTLLAQKQELLTKAIENTTKKLNSLKEAQGQVEAQFKSGKIGEEQYRAFQREISETEQSLKSYKTQIAAIQTEQDRLATNTKRLETLFEATGKNVDDFADVLGGRLTQAIKSGSANSDQLNLAINKIGKAALGADADLDKMRASLDKVGHESSLTDLKTDLSKISDEAGQSEKSLEDMSKSVSSGTAIQAANVISDLGDKVIELGKNATEASLEFQKAHSTINANTNLTAEETKKLGEVADNVFKNGVTDSIEEATQATIVMKQNFGNLNDTDLGNLTGQVITLSERTGTDVQENVRGASQLMNAFGLDSEEAFNLVASGYQNNLNYSGDFTDTLNEYAPLFAEAGYSANDMLSILENGMKNGAMNTDKTADAVKEMQVRLGDGSLEKVMENFSSETQNTFKKWGDGKATVKDVASSVQNDLKKMSPSDQQKALSNLSTQFEDLGIGAATSLFDIKSNFNDVSGAMDKAAESDPSQKWQASLNEFKDSMQDIGTRILEALQPVLDFIAKIADGFNSLSEPVQNFILIFGGILAVVAIITPVIAAIAAIGLATVGMAAAIAAGIGVAIAAIMALVLNWESIVDWCKELWSSLKDWLSELWNGLLTTLTGIWETIKQTTEEVWNSIVTFITDLWTSIVNLATTIFTPIIQVITVIFMTVQSVIQGIWLVITSLLQAAWNIIVSLASTIFSPIIDFFSGVWNSISSTISQVWTTVSTYLTGVWNSISSLAHNVFNSIASFLSGIWNSISNTASSIWNAISSFLSGIWNSIKNIASSVFGAISSVISTIWNGIRSTLSGIWNGLVSTASSVFNNMKNTISNIFNSIKSTAVSVWNGVKTAITTPIEAAKNTVSDIIETIKGFFSGLKLSFPKIDMPPLPHFKLNGKFSLNPPSVPHLDVDWFANGGILTKPTVFGQNGNSLMVGGEAGKEAVAPLSDLMSYVRQAVYEANGNAEMILLLQQLVQQGNSPITVNMEKVELYDDTDLTEFGHRFAKTIERQSKRNLGG